jgi:hypothetical protein
VTVESNHALTSRKGVEIRPIVLVGRPAKGKYFLQLVKVRGSREDWLALEHLAKDTPIDPNKKLSDDFGL